MALLEYKCPSCGGGLEYNSSVSKMKCPYCDTEIEMEALKALDADLGSQAEDNLNWNTDAGTEWSEADAAGTASYGCKSCGAQIVTDSTTTASSCPYCGSPIVMMGGLSGTLKPDFIIPFKLDRKAAKTAFEKHMSGKKLLPEMFKNAHHLEDISGVYVPFWIFDSDADASMTFKATKKRRYTEGKYDCVETSYFKIFRAGTIAFDNVPVDGSQKMDDALMDSLEPFNYSEAVDFQTAYLAGYLADKYDVSAEDSVERANIRIRRSTADAFRSTVTGYDTVENDESRINLKNGRTRYALLPAWILSTTWNGERYIFAMNGQTGKFVGNLPCDKSLIKKYFFKTAGIVSAIAFALLTVFSLL